MANPDLVDSAVYAVEEFCVPTKMSKEEAIDFLEEVICLLGSSIEALKEELENDR